MTEEQERRSTELMVRAVSGHREAYADLLILLTSVTRKYVRGRAGDVSWVDDVVQETLCSVHAALHTYDPSRPFAPWFYAIASRRLIDVVRRERRVQTREVGQDDLTRAPQPVDAGPGLDFEAIHAAVESLPPRQREIVTALKFRDESIREISARLEMTQTAVKVTAHRGYKTLRRLLGGRS